MRHSPPPPAARELGAEFVPPGQDAVVVPVLGRRIATFTEHGAQGEQFPHGVGLEPGGAQRRGEIAIRRHSRRRPAPGRSPTRRARFRPRAPSAASRWTSSASSGGPAPASAQRGPGNRRPQQDHQPAPEARKGYEVGRAPGRGWPAATAAEAHLRRPRAVGRSEGPPPASFATRNVRVPRSK